MSEPTLDQAMDAIAELVVNSQKMVVFTGAGISTESGIPDFRGPDGHWTKFKPEEHTFQRFVSDEDYRIWSWERFKTNTTFVDAEPNNAHLAIAELEKLGFVDCVITQNIDNLHQEAGSGEVIELHGTVKFVKCLECGVWFPREEIKARLVNDPDLKIPECEKCGGMLKSATISFGESMPVKETREATRRSEASDLFLIVGSSLVVQPAALMPVYAKQAGAKVIILNLSETPHDNYADIIINAKAGEILPPIVQKVKTKMKERAH